MLLNLLCSLENSLQPTVSPGESLWTTTVSSNSMTLDPCQPLEINSEPLYETSCGSTSPSRIFRIQHLAASGAAAPPQGQEDAGLRCASRLCSIRMLFASPAFVVVRHIDCYARLVFDALR